MQSRSALGLSAPEAGNSAGKESRIRGRSASVGMTERKDHAAHRTFAPQMSLSRAEGAASPCQGEAQLTPDAFWAEADPLAREASIKRPRACDSGRARQRSAVLTVGAGVTPARGDGSAVLGPVDRGRARQRSAALTVGAGVTPSRGDGSAVLRPVDSGRARQRSAALTLGAGVTPAGELTLQRYLAVEQPREQVRPSLGGPQFEVGLLVVGIDSDDEAAGSVANFDILDHA